MIPLSAAAHCASLARRGHGKRFLFSLPVNADTLSARLSARLARLGLPPAEAGVGMPDQQPVDNEMQSGEAQLQVDQLDRRLWAAVSALRPLSEGVTPRRRASAVPSSSGNAARASAEAHLKTAIEDARSAARAAQGTRARAATADAASRDHAAREQAARAIVDQASTDLVGASSCAAAVRALAAQAHAAVDESTREELVHSLAQASRAARPGAGIVYGTFRQLAWLEDDRVACACAASLGSGLRDGVVVETRADAELTCAQFKEQRVGGVWCVLRADTAEASLHKPQREQAPAGASWLSEAIGCAPEVRALSRGGVLRSAVDLLASDWLLCEDSSAAERLSRPREDRKRNYDCVTLDGHMFRRSGEMARAPSAKQGAGASPQQLPKWALLTRSAYNAAQHALGSRRLAPISRRCRMRS
ncbi:hypothetical protein T492DRAFT_888642 [Pavlovales sp. CCMP2436]|nr:hypothetical protein T492DRAFT_888642 [Pavlovales sp. CCMP2436]